METKKEMQSAPSTENKKVIASAATVKEITPKVLSIREQLEKELEKLNQRKELADKREFFLHKKEQLTRYKEYVLKELGQMETKRVKISFIGNDEYGREESRINVNNPEFVARYIDYLITDIDGFIAKIEEQLLTDVA